MKLFYPVNILTQYKSVAKFIKLKFYLFLDLVKHTSKNF